MTSRRTIASIFGALLVATLLAGPAEARKVALVIGNERYEHLESLQKAAADAAGYAAVLNAKGFDQVTLKQNLTRDQMDEAIADFVAAIGQGDVAVFVYSGHGWSNGSQNFIVGTDAPDSASEERLARIAIPVANGLNGIVDEMTRKGASLKVAIVDACRNNPFRPQTAGKSIGFGRGFNRLKEPPPDGTFMVFSAGAGQVALDRLSETDADPHGVFTRTFLPLLRGDLTLLDATKAAQERVFELAKAIGHDQLPAYYDEVKGKACLAGNCEGPATPAPIPGGQYSPELLFWTSIMNSTKAGDYRAYLEQYPSGSFAALARSRLAALEPSVPEDPAAPAGGSAECSGGTIASVGNAGVAEAVERCLKPGDVFRDCMDCPEMVVIPAGSFMMGSPVYEQDRDAREGPQHRVTIGTPLAVGRFEITRGQFASFVKDTGYVTAGRPIHGTTDPACVTDEDNVSDLRSNRSWQNPSFPQDDTHPVVCLVWDDATAFAAWLSDNTGRVYRLLTEAEWEYAARGGTTTRYSVGNAASELCEIANGHDRTAAKAAGREGSFGLACSDGYVFTAPVGSYVPNRFGLYDMHGNVSEWVADCWRDSYDAALIETSKGCDHPQRGGSWEAGPRAMRSAYRYGWDGIADSGVGFRVARTLMSP